MKHQIVTVFESRLSNELNTKVHDTFQEKLSITLSEFLEDRFTLCLIEMLKREKYSRINCTADNST